MGETENQEPPVKPPRNRLRRWTLGALVAGSFILNGMASAPKDIPKLNTGAYVSAGTPYIVESGLIAYADQVTRGNGQVGFATVVSHTARGGFQAGFFDVVQHNIYNRDEDGPDVFDLIQIGAITHINQGKKGYTGGGNIQVGIWTDAPRPTERCDYRIGLLNVTRKSDGGKGGFSFLFDQVCPDVKE